MITRFPGLTPTRSRATATDDLVSPWRSRPTLPATVYEQAVKVLARIDESLAMCGTDKSEVLSAIIYLNDVTQKKELNRAWDEWADAKNPPMRACIGVDIEPPTSSRSWDGGEVLRRRRLYALQNVPRR